MMNRRNLALAAVAASTIRQRTIGSVRIAATAAVRCTIAALTGGTDH